MSARELLGNRIIHTSRNRLREYYCIMAWCRH